MSMAKLLTFSEQSVTYGSTSSAFFPEDKMRLSINTSATRLFPALWQSGTTSKVTPLAHSTLVSNILMGTSLSLIFLPAPLTSDGYQVSHYLVAAKILFKANKLQLTHDSYLVDAQYTRLRPSKTPSTCKQSTFHPPKAQF